MHQDLKPMPQPERRLSVYRARIAGAALVGIVATVWWLARLSGLW